MNASRMSALTLEAGCPFLADSLAALAIEATMLRTLRRLNKL